VAAAADDDKSRAVGLMLLTLYLCLQSWPAAALQEELVQEQLLERTVPLLLQSRRGFAAIPGLRVLLGRGLVSRQCLGEFWRKHYALVCDIMTCGNTRDKLEVSRISQGAGNHSVIFS
jgi:hypothetical protein